MRRTESHRGLLTLTVLTALMGMACKDILQVDLPTRVSADALDNPALAQVLVNSAIGEFECAFPPFVMVTGEITDELRHSSSWYAMTIYDRRDAKPEDLSSVCTFSTGHGVYVPLQKARFAAEDAKRRLEGWTDEQVTDRTDKIAQVTAYGAYARTLLGEAFCEMAIDEGTLMTPTQVLQSAEQMFGEAITAARAAGNVPIENMALVGRARVRLTLGDGAGAKADAQLVPSGFKRVTTHSAADQYRWNRVYRKNHLDKFTSVSDEFRNLTFGGVADPRVVVVPSATLGHNGRPMYLQTKYTGYNSPITLASWQEAQLIIAEVDLGQPAVDVINALHAAVGLPDYTPADVNDDAEILAQVLRERSRQLFLEGHRLNDFLRHDLPFAAGPSPYDGVTYGTTTCLPLPRTERDGNPNIP